MSTVKSHFTSIGQLYTLEYKHTHYTKFSFVKANKITKQLNHPGTRYNDFSKTYIYITLQNTEITQLTPRRFYMW